MSNEIIEKAVLAVDRFRFLGDDRFDTDLDIRGSEIRCVVEAQDWFEGEYEEPKMNKADVTLAIEKRLIKAGLGDKFDISVSQNEFGSGEFYITITLSLRK